jgi:hypothetical protein
MWIVLFFFKKKVIFLIYDINKDKKISKVEAVTAFTEITKQSKQKLTKEEIEKIVDEIFLQMDTNNDGILTKEEINLALSTGGIKNSILLNLPKKKYQKILLLGTSEVGKSTFAKQIERKYIPHHIDENLDVYKNLIIFNIFTSIKMVYPLIENSISSKEWKSSYEIIKELSIKKLLSMVQIYSQYKNFVIFLINNDTFIKCLSECVEKYYLNENIFYFIGLIKNEKNFVNYNLKSQDILQTYIKTEGIHSSEELFSVNKVLLSITDVGGSRPL